MENIFSKEIGKGSHFMIIRLRNPLLKMIGNKKQLISFLSKTKVSNSKFELHVIPYFTFKHVIYLLKTFCAIFAIHIVQCTLT